MKKKKRNSSARAFKRGYLAGIEGRSRSQCPHESTDSRHEWLSGWREGREDHWNGYNTFSQAQKFNV